MPRRQRVAVDGDEGAGDGLPIGVVEPGRNQQTKRQHGHPDHRVPQDPDGSARPLHNSAHFTNKTLAIMANKSFSTASS